MFKHLLWLSAAIFSFNVHARVCVNADGIVPNVDFNLTKELNKSDNVVGKTFTVKYTAKSGIDVYAICKQTNPAESTKITMRSYVTDFPIVEKKGKYQYLKLNDYLEGGMLITDSAAGTYYPPVNYMKMGSDPGVKTGERFQVKDTSLTFNFLVTKSFVGRVDFNMAEVFKVYVTTKKTDPLTDVVYTISFSGNIIAPQSCEINAGQVIAINFGNIGAAQFSSAGAGNKPSDVNVQTRNVAVKCTNVDANALLSMRIESNKVSNNALVSDNPDLGFVIADDKGKALTPNDPDSIIPFNLDDNASANVPIQAWPVSITGKRPAEGTFTSQAYLRVDFD